MNELKNYSVFDILGPIMIGPSSSHTAGAARLGKIAGIIAGGDIVKAKFLLYGSFAKTYKGHGTDKALVAGILGMDPWDERLRDSISIAKEKNIEIYFQEENEEACHPNTVKFVITRKDGKITEVEGSSIGGGNIVVNSIDGDQVQFTGEYPTLIVRHKDVPGVVSKVTTLLYNANVNIAFMKVFRTDKGQRATMVFELDNNISSDIYDEMQNIPHISSVRVINSLRSY